MKKFIIRFFIFTIVFITALHIIYISNIYKKFVPGTEVYTAIERTLVPNQKTTILLSGDSVGKQLFDSLNNKKSYTSIACNNAIDIIGHYLLIHDFISKPNKLKKIYFLYNPLALENDLDHKFTYNYFLKPFYNSHYITNFSQKSINKIKKIPYYNLSNFPVIKIFNFAPKVTSRNKKLISDTSIEYLNKIINLLEKKNIEFIILSPPIKGSFRDKVLNIIKEYEQSFFKNITLDIYFNNITFLSGKFFSDHVHIKNKYIKKIRDDVIKKFEQF